MTAMPATVSAANRAEAVTPTNVPACPVWPARTRRMARGGGLFLLVTFTSWLSVDLGQHSGGVATIWLTNGMIFAMVIRRARSDWPRLFAIEYFGDVCGALLCHTTFASALGTSLCNSVEIFLSAYLLTQWFPSPFRLSRPRPLLAFLSIAVVAVPILASAAATSWMLFLEPGPWGLAWRTWFLGDALGMAMIAPLVFVVLQEPDFFVIFRRDKIFTTLLVLSAPVVATLLDFGQSKEAIAILIMPSLVLVVFRLGFPGTVVGIVVSAILAIGFTAAGHGPFSLIAGIGVLHRIVLVQVLYAIALLTAFPVASLIEEQRRLEHSLQESELRYCTLAHTDPLTGQANRRAFEERLQQEWSHCAAELHPFTLLAIDVDRFKAYNDLYGHIAGDDCLRHIATIAAETLHLRTSARLYRLGGEEFAVLLPNCDPGEALALAERIRIAVHGTGIVHAGSASGLQTISLGVATTVPDAIREPLALLDLADRALYRAKENGRNRCEVA